MNAKTTTAALLLLLAAGNAGAQDVGSYVPAFELEDFASTEAKSLDDFLGRTLLIEFFAYW